MVFNTIVIGKTVIIAIMILNVTIMLNIIVIGKTVIVMNWKF